MTDLNNIDDDLITIISQNDHIFQIYRSYICISDLLTNIYNTDEKITCFKLDNVLSYIDCDTNINVFSPTNDVLDYIIKYLQLKKGHELSYPVKIPVGESFIESCTDPNDAYFIIDLAKDTTMFFRVFNLANYMGIRSLVELCSAYDTYNIKRYLLNRYSVSK